MIKCAGIKELLCAIRSEFFKHKLYYWADLPNAGDTFNADILNYFGIRYELEKSKKATLLGLGSILERIIIPESFRRSWWKRYPPIKVMGAGFLRERSGGERALKKTYVMAVRGKASLERLKKLNNVYFDKDLVIADPGIMASLMYKFENLHKKYDVGIIPHYRHDKTSPCLSNIKLEKYSSTLIDIQESPMNVCRKICECDFILSSSLHGLIFSDSFGVPNFHIVLSDKVEGGEYKFRDYYSAYETDYPGNVNLTERTVSDADIDELKSRYQIKTDKIRMKQNQLAVQYKKLARQGTELSRQD